MTTIVPHSSLPFVLDVLIENILLRLPVRSLVRFKSVCKSWKTLISSSQFAKEHLQLSTADSTTHQQPRLAYAYSDAGIWRVGSLPVFNNPSSSDVVSFQMERPTYGVGSCNGLLCVHDRFRFRLWNPSTRLSSEWIQVENPNPNKERVFFAGFGYDHVHDKYKLIVCVGLPIMTSKLYTFDSNSWTTIYFPIYCCDRQGTFVSGTLNWLAYYSRSGNVPNRTPIHSFDLVKETFRQLPLPYMNDDDMNDEFFDGLFMLGVLRNYLCVSLDHKKTHWALWLMKEYGVEQSWTKLVMIPWVEPWDLDNYRLVPYFKPLHMWENGVVLAEIADKSKLVLYNMSDGRVEYHHIESSSEGDLDYPIPKSTFFRDYLYFHESLVSLSSCLLAGLAVD